MSLCGQAAARELQVEDRAMLLARRNTETPAMLFDDRPAERQAKSGTGRLGREEDVENMNHLFGCVSDTGTADSIGAGPCVAGQVKDAGPPPGGGDR